MVAAVTLADASIDALDALCALEQESFATPWSRTAVAQEFATPHAHVVVAQAAGRIVGYLCRWLVIDEVHIQRIAVHPQYRQQGIGRALMALSLIHI